MDEEEFLMFALNRLKDVKSGLERQGFLMDFTKTQLLSSVKELLTEIEDIETINNWMNKVLSASSLNYHWYFGRSINMLFFKFRNSIVDKIIKGEFHMGPSQTLAQYSRKLTKSQTRRLIEKVSENAYKSMDCLEHLKLTNNEKSILMQAVLTNSCISKRVLESSIGKVQTFMGKPIALNKEEYDALTKKSLEYEAD